MLAHERWTGDHDEGKRSEAPGGRRIEGPKQDEIRLHPNADRFRILLHSSGDAVFVHALTEEPLAGRCLEANEAACRLFGYSRDEFLRLRAADLIADERHRKDVLRHLDDLRSRGRAQVHTLAKTRTGQHLEVGIRAHTITLDGEPAVLVIVRDLTGQDRVNLAITNAKEEWERTVDAVPDMIAILDRNYRIVRLNRAMANRLGCTPREALGKTCYKWVHGTDAPPDFCPHRRLLADGRRHTAVVHEPCLGGDFLFTVCPMHNARGELVGSVQVVHDVTDEKRNERKLRALLQLHRNTLETIPSAILVLNAQLNVIMANSRFFESRELTADQTIGRNITEIFPGPVLDRENLHERIRKVAALGGQDSLHGLQLGAPERGGEVVNLHVCGVRPLEGQATESRVLLVIEDVTSQHSLQEQVRQAIKMESVGKLAGGVAHDFNNLLTGIGGYTDLLLRQASEDSSEYQDLLQIRELSDRAADLTRHLLAFSRRQPLQPRVVNLNSLIENLSKMLSRLIGEDIHLRFDPGEHLGNVEADPGQIEQVLLNLAVNARDAMPDGGELSIKTDNVVIDREFARDHVGSSPGRTVMLSVSDTGCGMDAETVAHIFEPFFTTKELGRGTGLGLSTVYGIVKQHGGSIWVYSAPGEGTTFRIYLPRVAARAEEHRRRPRLDAQPTGSECILVVDDELAIRTLVTRILRSSGYTVHTAADCEEAEAVMTIHGPEIDLLLTDVVLPRLNGREIYDRLSARYPNLRVLYMSGYAESVIAHQGVCNDGAVLIPKPFSPGELSIHVREALSTPPGRPKTPQIKRGRSGARGRRQPTAAP